VRDSELRASESAMGYVCADVDYGDLSVDHVFADLINKRDYDVCGEPVDRESWKRKRQNTRACQKDDTTQQMPSQSIYWLFICVCAFSIEGAFGA